MKKSIEKLQTILKAGLSGRVKNFYIGDPWIFPESVLPAIVIAPDNTETNIADNTRDMHTHNIIISLIIDARTYFNATPDKMVGTIFLMNTMEEEETSTPGIKSNTVLGILRENLNLDTNRFIENISSINYTTRRRTEELITLEATATLQIQFIVNR